VKTVQVSLRDHHGVDVPEPLTILVDGQLPDLDGGAVRLEFQDQAGRLAHALHGALPGGTWDALLAEMLRVSASVLRVGHRDVPDASPTGTAPCPKCGSADAWMGYCDSCSTSHHASYPNQLCRHGDPEHFHHGCRQCRHEWRTDDVIDAKVVCDG
jgi:hypothetical protein